MNIITFAWLTQNQDSKESKLGLFTLEKRKLHHLTIEIIRIAIAQLGFCIYLVQCRDHKFGARSPLKIKIEGEEGPPPFARPPRHATDLVPYDVTSFRFSWNK